MGAVFYLKQQISQAPPQTFQLSEKEYVSEGCAAKTKRSSCWNLHSAFRNHAKKGRREDNIEEMNVEQGQVTEDHKSIRRG